MKVSKTMYTQRTVAGLIVLAMLAPFANAATPAGRGAVAQEQQQQTQQPAQTQQQQPSTTDAQPAPAEQQQQQQPSQAQPQVAPGLETRPETPNAPEQAQPAQDQRPVGTAAAPLTKPTGVAASRPAGAAIAPAKQRRVKKIVIRVGIIVGAAVAVGAVAGLSRSSPSRP